MFTFPDNQKVGYGTWKIKKEDACEIVYLAIKNGVRHLDCACDYGNEVEVGQGIAKAISEGLVTRKDLFITSKLWNTYHKKEHVEMACKKDIADLNCDYLDLYLVHFPIALKYVPIETRYPPEWIFDPTCDNPKIEQVFIPMSETWNEMENLQNNGLTKNIGVCNLNVQYIMDILGYCKIKPAVNQVELHPYLSQTSLLEYCEIVGIHVTAYSPLGSSSYVEMGMDQGLSTGAIDEISLKEIAILKNKTPAQVVLRWHLQRGTSLIPKSSNINRIVENLDIFSFELTKEEMLVISNLNRNKRFNDPGIYTKFMGANIPIFA